MEIPSKSKGEHYNLRWNSYTNNLVQVLLDHQQHENLVDVTLCCEGQFIKAHKLVLSACSEVFQEMFKVHSVQHPIIILNGIKFNHFKHILEFIYQGEVKVLDVDLEGVLALGESLKVKGLSSIKLKHQVSSEELRTAANLTECRTNSLPSSPALDRQHFFNPISNNQPKPKNFNSNNQPQTEYERTPEIKRMQTNEHNHLSLNKVQTSSINLSTNYNKNISKLEDILTDPKEVTHRKRFKPAEIVHPAVSNRPRSAENESISETEKNSRPANAFMIFANEWRNKLAVEHPDENNKAISVKLGQMWKSLSNETKQSYYLAAKKLELEPKPKNMETSSKNDTLKKKRITRRKTIDSISHLVSVNLQEFDDDDDLQIIEINENPVDVPRFQKKRNRYNRNANNT